MKYAIKITELDGTFVAYLSDKNKLSWCKKTAKTKAKFYQKDNPQWILTVEENGQG